MLAVYFSPMLHYFRRSIMLSRHFDYFAIARRATIIFR